MVAAGTVVSHTVDESNAPHDGPPKTTLNSSDGQYGALSYGLKSGSPGNSDTDNALESDAISVCKHAAKEEVSPGVCVCVTYDAQLTVIVYDVTGCDDKVAGRGHCMTTPKAVPPSNSYDWHPWPSGKITPSTDNKLPCTATTPPARSRRSDACCLSETETNNTRGGEAARGSKEEEETKKERKKG